MSSEKKYLEIVRHYEECLARHGDSHLGVDWPRVEDVDKRYRVMLDLIRLKETAPVPVTLLDVGCGAAHLYEYILKTKAGSNIVYSGLDISDAFVQLCKKKFPDVSFFRADILEAPQSVPSFDYLIMNGVFTEKRNLTFEEMFCYFKNFITAAFQKANKGIAFNVMSKAVDWERNDLFHLSADLLIDFMTRHLSRNFVIRNDYGLYEYTTYLYK